MSCNGTVGYFMPDLSGNALRMSSPRPTGRGLPNPPLAPPEMDVAIRDQRPATTAPTGN
jgi:hypothetical protein